MSLSAISGVDAGRVPFSHVAAALAGALEDAVEEARSAGGTRPRRWRRQAWAVRAVLVRAADDTWSPLAVAVRPGRVDDLTWDVHVGVDLTIGGVRLVSQPLRAADLEPPAGAVLDGSPRAAAEVPEAHDGRLVRLLGQIGAPRSVVTRGASPPYADVEVRRVAGRNAWLDEPCWVAEWAISLVPGPDGSTSPFPPIPRGRLFNPEHYLYYDDAFDAVAGWCRDPALAEAAAHLSHAVPRYRLVVPDDRAFVAGATRSASGVDVDIDGTRVGHGPDPDGGGVLFCVAVTTSLDGGSQREVLDVRPRDRGGAGRLRPEPRFVASVGGGSGLASVAVTLFDAEGVEYDHCVLRDLAAPAGTDLLDDTLAYLRVHSQTLDDARRRGECDTVEFKPFVAVTRGKDGHDKARELLETLTAFANAGGGSLFLGISDHADVLGVAGGLAKEYGPVGSDAATPDAREQARRAAYAADVRKLIAEGVVPSLEARFTWRTTAGLAVLQVEVGRGARRPYVVADRQEVYVRRGATNARPTPGELRAFLSSDT